MMLYRMDGTIGIQKVLQTGGRLTIARGLLSGLNGESVKADRNRRQMQLRFRFDDIERRVWVG